MNTNIENIHFTNAEEKEKSIILSFTRDLFYFGFQKRLFISIVISIFAVVIEFFGKKSQDQLDIFPESALIIFAALILFNIFSFLYIILKEKLNLYTLETEIIYGKISEKSKSKGPLYILFSTDKYECTTALTIKYPSLFDSLKVGDEILVTRSTITGTAKYNVYPTHTKKTS